jgi:hypothetical protein
MGALSLSAEPPSPVAKGVAMALAPPAIAKFTGMFSNPGYGDLVVSLNGTILSISYYGSSWQLDQFGDTTFLFTVGAFGTFFPVLVEYYRDNDGAIAGLSAQLVQRPLLMMIPFAKR